uniref:Peroxisomal ATPase PEX1 n=1 Tax=Steinernema glaseri TaxID=37863 RepID=A0A1I8A664_9BILA
MANRGSRRSLPCFLALHRREHCFGYFGSEKIEGEPSFSAKKLFECRSCGNPDKKIVLEVAECRGSGPISHLYISDRFAYCNGMDEGEELILEEIVSSTVCSRIVIEPATTNDFEILQCSRGQVELVFLDQLRFVAKGMLFPIWVEQNVCVIFRVVSIEPPMAERIVRLAANTEVEINMPSTASRSDSALSSPPLKSTGKAVPSDVLSSLTAMSPLDALLSHCDFPETDKPMKPAAFRVLFQSFFEERSEFGPHNVVLSVSTEETGSIPKFQIVEVEREELRCCAIWVRIPTGTCSEFYRRVGAIIADRKDHCIISNNMRKAGFHDGFKIRLHAFARQHYELVSEVTVECREEVNEGTISKALKAHFESSVVSMAGFCVMSRSGLPVKLNVAGQSISVVLKPNPDSIAQGLSTTRRCFVFSTSKMPTFKFEESLDKHEGTTEKEGTKPSEHESTSFGNRNVRSNHVPLMCQSSLVASIVSSVAFTLKEYGQCRKQGAHYLLTGSRLCGKSTLLRLLALELERHPLTVFSKYIDCRSWKGKSSETIEKKLGAAISLLKQRQPAMLFLDNIDYFSLKNEGEERVISIEKLFFTIRDVIEKSGILVCATAKSTHTVNKMLMSSQGKRYVPDFFYY